MMRRSFLALALLLAPSISAAQSVRVGATYLRSSDELIRGGVGPDVALSILLPARMALVVGAAGTRHSFRSRNSVCAGLIPPGMDCSEEPTQHRATLAFARAGVEVPLVRWATGSLAVGPEFLLGSEESSMRGDRSGRTLDADARRSGFGLAATLQHQLLGPVPAQLVIAGGVAGSWNPGAEVVLDGYTPLNDDDTIYRVTLGIAFGLGRGRGGP